jgi:TatD DNase family protein
MIDTHCHLDHKQFDADRAAMLERAFAEGVEAMIIPAVEPSRFEAVRSLVASDARLFCGIGIHPHHASEATPEALRRVEELSEDERVQAIGEIGLDYHYNFAPRDVQQEVFRKHLRLAKQRGLPIIVHNRESDNDLFNLLHEEQDGSLKGVLHCFSSPPERAREAVDLGFHVSFTGNITFKSNAALAESVAEVPLDRLMIETDAPYMAPVPHRGKRNEPAYVRLVAEKIAEIRSCSLHDVLAMTTTNARTLFRLVLVMIVLASTLSSSFVLAQTTDDDDDDQTVQDPYFNPYPKKFGLALSGGLNTISESFSEGGQSTLTRGAALGIGASMVYNFTDNIGLGLSFLTMQNTAVQQINPVTQRPFQEFPNYHRAVDAYVQYTFVPGKVVNFYVQGGASLVANAFDAKPTTPFGPWIVTPNFTGGLGVNIATSWGVLYPAVEYRFNVAFGLQEPRVFSQPGSPPQTRIQTGFVYSIPRLSVWFFPTFGR